MIDQALTQAGLLGAERADLACVIAALSPGQVSDMAASVAASDVAPGVKLLKLAAIEGICYKAGFAPETHCGLHDSVALQETSAVASSDGVQTILEVGHARVHHEVFSLMHQACLRVPDFKLRSILDMGSANVALRPLMIPLLGAKGRWLAQQHTSWAWAKSAGEGSSHEEKWRTGSLQERIEALRTFRMDDAASARERLMSEMASHPPAERAALVGCLRHGLSLGDEIDLNKLLLDRAKEPRQAAAALLSSLPGSAYGRRAEKRMAALLVRCGASRSWTFHVPDQFDPEWERDGIEVQRPKVFNHLGEKAWWLQQLVAVTHPAWFSEHTHLMPDELVKVAADGEWADPVIAGWIQALKLMPTPEWAAALMDAKTKYGVDREHLLGMLSMADLERKWLKTVASANPQKIDALEHIIGATPIGRTWSERLSSSAVDLLLRYGRQGGFAKEPMRLATLLTDLLCVLHPLSVAGSFRRLQQEGAMAHMRNTAQLQLISNVRSRLSAWLPIHPQTA